MKTYEIRRLFFRIRFDWYKGKDAQPLFFKNVIKNEQGRFKFGHYAIGRFGICVNWNTRILVPVR